MLYDFLFLPAGNPWITVRIAYPQASDISAAEQGGEGAGGRLHLHRGPLRLLHDTRCCRFCPLQ